jgi:Raf kinase inhibitor-like YbhB/YbcL family protein
MRSMILVAGLGALVACGAANNDRQEAPAGRITLTSNAFGDGQPIVRDYSCDGANRAPALSWSDPPAGTKSFALALDDPDAPGGTFRHWGVYDIPASARSIGGGATAGTEVVNDKGSTGYTGPCPPKGHGVHHYHFRLFALDVERLGLAPKATIADVEKAAGEHAIARGELTGTYERR